MGKKSKKGVSRAGTKARPKAGAGKTRTRSRSMDGEYSQASSDNNILQSETLSVESMDAAPFVKTNNTVTTAANNNNSNLPPMEVQYPTSNTPTPAATATPVVEAKPVVSPTTAAVVEPVVEKEKAKKPTPPKKEDVVAAVTPVKVKDIPSTTKAAAVLDDDAKVQSRGLALDQPAPEEAQTKQKDCECIIL